MAKKRTKKSTRGAGAKANAKDGAAKRARPPRRAKNVIQLAPLREKSSAHAEPSEEETVRALMENSRVKRVAALLHELENGKGISRIQAENRLAEIEREMSAGDDRADVVVNLDVVATRHLIDGGSTAGAG